ncbi:MAG: hypothetical protein U0324_34975 [Polyangiales bacterium]
MRERHDALGKDLLVTALRDVGTVERGVESGATTQRVDVLFRPDAAHHAARLQRGLLGALVDARECHLEPFRNTPPVPAVRGCVRRLWVQHHVRELEGRRDDPPKSSPMPRAIVISPGRPEGALEVFACGAAEGHPPGVFRTHDELGLWVVVAAELPETPETLACRLLGRGETFRRAVEALRRLPPDAWEHRLLDVLVQWRSYIAQQPTRTEEDEEFMNAVQAAYERDQARARNEGLSQGLLPLTHQFERRLGRALSDGERATIAERLRTVGPVRLGDVVLDLASDALAAWLADPAAR